MPPLCGEHSGHERQLDEQQRRIATLESAIFEIRDRLLNRPGWVMTTLLSILTAAVSVLAMLYVNASRSREYAPPPAKHSSADLPAQHAEAQSSPMVESVVK